MNMKTETKNATIKDTMLGFEGHGILTAMITLDYGGSCQGYGGYRMDGGNDDFLAKSIIGILNVVGVDSWESLKGKHIRVEKEDSWNGKILRIGNFLEEKWFSFK